MYALFSAETTIWWLGPMMKLRGHIGDRGNRRMLTAFLPEDNKVTEQGAVFPVSDWGWRIRLLRDTLIRA